MMPITGCVPLLPGETLMSWVGRIAGTATGFGPFEFLNRVGLNRKHVLEATPAGIDRLAEITGAPREAIERGAYTRLDLRYCSHRGERFASRGEKGLREAFDSILSRFRTEALKGGPQAAFGRLYQWLQFNRGTKDRGPNCITSSLRNSTALRPLMWSSGRSPPSAASTSRLSAGCCGRRAPSRSCRVGG